jgi:hypothetical protein
VELQKRVLHLSMGSLPVMLQVALLLSMLPSLSISGTWMVLSQRQCWVASISFAFHTFIAAAAVVYGDCPFQAPLSIMLLESLLREKRFTALTRVWLKQRTILLLSGLDL